MKRGLYLVAGWISLGLGIIGIPVPLLPTTPFLLLAAVCFARGSDHLHDWLLNHPRFGPPITQWQQYKAIGRQAKWLGTVSMLVLFGFSILMGVPTWALIAQGSVLAVVSLFLWTRREPPQNA